MKYVHKMKCLKDNSIISISNLFENRKLKPNKEFFDALEELDYMEKHPKEYKSFPSVKELMEDLNSDD